MEGNRSSKTRLALKIFVALLAGAALPAVIVTLMYSISSGATQAPESSLREGLSAAPVVFVFALAFTAAHAFILGLPLLLLGIKLRAIRWWTCILVSFLIGFIPTAWASGTDFMSVVRVGEVGGGLGCIGGLTFWLVWHFWVQRTSATGTGTPVEPVAHPTAPDGG